MNRQTHSPRRLGWRIFWTTWISFTVAAALLPLIPMAPYALRRFFAFRSIPAWMTNPDEFVRTYVLFLLYSQAIAIPIAATLGLVRRTFARVHALRGSALTHCPTCGYDLTGNTTGICSECGWQRAGPGWFLDPGRRWRSGILFLAVLATIFVFLRSVVLWAMKLI